MCSGAGLFDEPAADQDADGGCCTATVAAPGPVATTIGTPPEQAPAAGGCC
ncbi:hypothetical protein OH807_00535 [Kitasatospora sp. NBC_01560]|uniref:hypothetical protein n=1 Tax=Kitasatospora sp. NBC_01560 TaxID=2975965 RepID=UPI003866FC9B